MNTNPKKQGFTLIELIVVIAILGILLSILVPIGLKHMEFARRTVCKGRLEQLGIGHLTYAAEHDGNLPPHQAKVDSLGLGVYAVYARTWKQLAEADRYRGNGVLYHLDYLSAKFLYCPSWTQPYTQHGQVNPTNYRGGPIWKLENFPSHQAWMQTSYTFRGAMGLLTEGSPRSPNIFMDPVTTPIAADHFSDPGRSTNFHHKEGYNAVYLDGSVRWIHDPADDIRLYNGGATYHAGRANYQKQEQVWYTYFGR